MHLQVKAKKRAISLLGVEHLKGVVLEMKQGLQYDVRLTTWTKCRISQKRLVRYHYAVRYEGLPLDAELEHCLEKEIDKW